MTQTTIKLNPEQDRLRLWKITERLAGNHQVEKTANILRVAQQLGRTEIDPQHLASQEQTAAATPFGYQSFTDILSNEAQTAKPLPLPRLHESVPSGATTEVQSFYWMRKPDGPTLRASLKSRGPLMISIKQYHNIIDLMHDIQQANSSFPAFSMTDVMKMVDPNICVPESARQLTHAVTAYLIHRDIVAKNGLTTQKAFTITIPDILMARHHGLSSMNTALTAARARHMPTLL